jgi:hypothetical protein
LRSNLIAAGLAESYTMMVCDNNFPEHEVSPKLSVPFIYHHIVRWLPESKERVSQQSGRDGEITFT